MTSDRSLIWVVIGALAAYCAALLALTVALWPPQLGIGLLLAALYIVPLVAAWASATRRGRRARLFTLSADELMALSDDELAAYQLEKLGDAERRLELRELRLARQQRTARVAGNDYVDLLETQPTDTELERLVGKDRQLLALIEEESTLVFNRIRANRYAAEHGVNGELIVADTRLFVEKIARLYRPDAEHPLLETDIELMAKSLSSASLHMLMVVDDLPLNFKSYNAARVYRQLRRGANYYGTYKAFRPYLDYGFNTLQFARLALGFNPVAVGTSWIAGKLAARGAQLVGERVLQRTALQLLNDFIRVIAFETAMMYGGGFQYRDANWLFAAELVNLEISRGKDYAGRDTALETLCSVVLRNEFDRVHLLTNLSRRKPIATDRIKPAIAMTAAERQRIAEKLHEHAAATGADLTAKTQQRWLERAEEVLGVVVGNGEA